MRGSGDVCFDWFFLFVLQEMKVNWATSPGNQPKQDTSSKYIFFIIYEAS